MSRFEVEIEGLEEVRAKLDAKELDKKLILGMGDALRQLHNELRDEVQNTYNAPKSLDKALQTKKSASSLKQAKNFIEMSLIYEDRQRFLAEFPYKIELISPSAQPWIPVPNLYMPDFKNGRVKRKKPVQEITVAVKRGKPATLSSSSAFQGAFTGTISGKKQILVRKGKETWELYPEEGFEEGERATYFPLYGPDLARMADSVYSESPRVQQALENVYAYMSEQIFK